MRYGGGKRYHLEMPRNDDQEPGMTVVHDFTDYRPQHFGVDIADKVATITLNRPERKNPLTCESYAELRDTFRGLAAAESASAESVGAKPLKAVVLPGA